MESLFSSLRSLLAVALQIKAHESVIVPVLVLQCVVPTSQFQEPLKQENVHCHILKKIQSCSYKWFSDHLWPAGLYFSYLAGHCLFNSC